jgi:cell division protein FtsL
VSVAVPARGPARRKAAQAAPKAVRRSRPRRRRVTAGGLAWVAVLAALMFGIVALNVAALRSSIDVSRMRDRVQQLERQNGLLRNQTINLSNPYAIGRRARGYGMVPADAITTKHVRLSNPSSGGRPAP